MIITKQRTLKRFLRSPNIIVAEIGTITLACVLGAVIPQIGSATDAERAFLQESGSLVSLLVNIFALDHVFKSVWFLCLILVASASLLIVINEQIRRLRITWSKCPSEAQFRNAPFKTEFERSAGECNNGRQIDVRVKGKLGLAGSLVFHIGILLLIVAGILRALFAVEAVVDLMETETLPTTVEVWGAQWPGILAKPFQLDYHVTLDEVKSVRYKSGALKDLKVILSIEKTKGVEKHEVAINQEFQTSAGRLFLSSDYGPTALIEWQKDGNSLVKDAVIMTDKGNQTYEASISWPNGLQAYLRSYSNPYDRPTSIEMRVMKDKALMYVGRVSVGQAVQLPEGQTLLLHGIPLWARIRASRDPALWLAYIGFAMGLIGSVMIFFLIKIDTCVIVSPAGDRQRVFVALRAQRFAPLFEGRFKKLVHDQGGSA